MNLEIGKAPQLSENARYYLEQHIERQQAHIARHERPPSQGEQLSMRMAQEILAGEREVSPIGLYYTAACTKSPEPPETTF